MQRSQSCSCPLASSDDPACGGVLRVAGGVVAVAERGPDGGVEERERPPEGSIEGGMDLLKCRTEEVCNVCFLEGQKACRLKKKGAPPRSRAR